MRILQLYPGLHVQVITRDKENPRGAGYSVVQTLTTTLCTCADSSLAHIEVETGETSLHAKRPKSDQLDRNSVQATDQIAITGSIGSVNVDGNLGLLHVPVHQLAASHSQNVMLNDTLLIGASHKNLILNSDGKAYLEPCPEHTAAAPYIYSIDINSGVILKKILDLLFVSRYNNNGRGSCRVGGHCLDHAPTTAADALRSGAPTPHDFETQDLLRVSGNNNNGRGSCRVGGHCLDHAPTTAADALRPGAPSPRHISYPTKTSTQTTLRRKICYVYQGTTTMAEAPAELVGIALTMHPPPLLTPCARGRPLHDTGRNISPSVISQPHLDLSPIIAAPTYCRRPLLHVTALNVALSDTSQMGYWPILSYFCHSVYILWAGLYEFVHIVS
ncbi:hypothetical protein J6590_057553 [Homalodisca vitripennis]|nr:hypothetical protein J6590_057553 [Homalodisca vitripennis]